MLILKRTRDKITQKIRGNLIIKEQNKEEYIIRSITKSEHQDVPEKMVNTLINEVNVISKRQARLVILQYLFFTRIQSLEEAIQICYGTSSCNKIAFGLPSFFINFLQKQGLDFHKNKSYLLWIRYLFKRLIKALKTVVETLKEDAHKKVDSYEYLSYLSPNCFPDIRGDMYDNVLTSLTKKKLVKSKEIRHDVKSACDLNIQGYTITYQASEIPSLPTLSTRVLFFVRCTKITVKSIILALFKNTTLLIFIDELIKLEKFRLCRKSDLADAYFFNNSNAVFKPLWTYIAEESGTNIYLYFYSTNNEYFMLSERCKPEGYSLMTWRNIYVWNSFQRNIILRNLQYQDVQLLTVGSIEIQGQSKNLNLDQTKTNISIFDVPPMSEKNLGLATYYLTETVIKFVEDIVELSIELSFVPVLKTKRESAKHCSRYTIFIQNLSHQKLIILVNPGVSASNVIAQTDMSISIPYTSTGIIAAEQDKPSCYYDWTGHLKRRAELSHNLDLIKSKNDLKKWIVLNNPKYNQDDIQHTYTNTKI